MKQVGHALQSHEILNDFWLQLIYFGVDTAGREAEAGAAVGMVAGVPFSSWETC